MKKIYITTLCMVITIMLTLTGCASNQITIPDIYNVSINDGRSVLSSMGLIPQIEYIYNDSIAKDNIIYSEPSIGTPVEQGTKVVIYVSKGPSIIYSTNSYLSWNYITNGVEDDWEFYSPYIKDNYLYIECYNVTFGTAMEWRDRYNEGAASGTASINDTFDKVVPVKVIYEKQKYSANKSQAFTIKVPLNDLENQRPTTLYFRIGIRAKSKDIDLTFNFSMSW